MQGQPDLVSSDRYDNTRGGGRGSGGGGLGEGARKRGENGEMMGKMGAVVMTVVSNKRSSRGSLAPATDCTAVPLVASWLTIGQAASVNSSTAGNVNEVGKSNDCCRLSKTKHKCTCPAPVLSF